MKDFIFYPCSHGLFERFVKVPSEHIDIRHLNNTSLSRQSILQEIEIRLTEGACFSMD